MKRMVSMKYSGFSTLEMLTVLAIIAFLALLALPKWQVWQDAQKLQQESERLQLFLHQARYQAFAENQNIALVVDKQSQKWCLSAEEKTGKDTLYCSCFQEKSCRHRLKIYRPFFNNVQLNAVKVYPQHYIVFDGTRSTAGQAKALTLRLNQACVNLNISNVGRIRLTPCKKER